LRRRLKTMPPSVNPRPNVPTANAPMAIVLREALPAGERGLLLRRQRLAATALANRPAGAQTEIEIVEELGRLVHAMSV